MVVSTLVEAAVVVVAVLDEGAVYALQSTGVLGHPVRRRVVSILIERDIVRREQLAERLAADETISRADTEYLEIVLHHQHLPVLESEQFVEYDQRNGDVILWKDPGDAAERLDST